MADLKRSAKHCSDDFPKESSRAGTRLPRTSLWAADWHLLGADARLCFHFSIGIALSSTHVRFPFFAIYVSLFALLILAISVHWLIHAVALLKKKDWSGIFMACLGFGGCWFGIVLLVQAVVAYPNR